ncbi:asb055 [Agrotis segetum nucleopolyhedrovirus B]|uniref:Asb055 n=1 Tax=Agrotis segetum nucleopolyhedrovirus B TaxID=1580580 RepID=A0A0A7KR74_9ABAC|nr:asb055 [Agrotis segetum nucleopolyhedrovirus B]AIZ48613.1 asb055 [Agrotis segetum nucleopolyhedrovirus B]
MEEDGGGGTLAAQYVSVQRQVLDNISQIGAHSDDEPGSVLMYRQIVTNMKEYLQSLRNVKMNFENINYSDASIKKILESLESDESTIIDLSDLLHRKIRLHDPPIAVRAAASNMMRDYDVITTLNRLADQVGVLEFRNLLYSAELESLLAVNVFKIQLHNGTDLNRVDCAAILLQALIKNNNRNVNFEGIVNSESPLMIEKLKCLLHYLVCVCQMLESKKQTILDTPITIRHHEIDPKTIMIADNTMRIEPDNVVVDKYTPYHKYENRNSVGSNEFTILYVNGEVGARAFDDNASHEDLWYMKCPELYVLPHFIRKTLGDNESYVAHDMKQYNVLTNVSYNTKRVYDAESYEALPLHNFLMYESCDYKIHTDTVQSDLRHLDREIAKLMSGIRYEQARFVEPLVFRAGPYNCHDNRTFQFLIELLVCMHENSKLYYCASNFDQQKELNDTLEAISTYTVSQLYNRLANYNFNTTGPMNFYRR